MQINGPTKLTKLGVLTLSTMMLITLLVPLSSGEAEASGPCPWYSIQDVFDDPNGNWDRDGLSNSDDLLNGLNPCVSDTSSFCGGGGNPLCIYPSYSTNYVPHPCQVSVTAYPTGDYDGDGITNAEEQRNYANPCKHPCPGATNADLALNPNGDWDGDRTSNAVEVNRGTNPCVSAAYIVCPTYSHYDVNADPHGDWDYDGITNAEEVRRGYNPCVYTTVRAVYTPPARTLLPHVSNTTTVYVAPAPKPVVRTCPAGYPYYHRDNGLCYANPVGYQTWR